MINPKTDCHCHILPGLDDGSGSLEESVALARRQVSWGFSKAVCTSHRVGKYPNVPEDEIKRLLDMGYQPVLAHPERYMYLDMERYHSLKDTGALFQRNVGSLEGLYGEAVSVRAEALLAENLYDLQGTDLHNERYAQFFDSFGFTAG